MSCVGKIRDNLTFRVSLCSMVWIERLFEVLEEKAVLYTGFKAFLKILQAASKFLRGSFISLIHFIFQWQCSYKNEISFFTKTSKFWLKLDVLNFLLFFNLNIKKLRHS